MANRESMDDAGVLRDQGMFQLKAMLGQIRSRGGPAQAARSGVASKGAFLAAGHHATSRIWVITLVT